MGAQRGVSKWQCASGEGRRASGKARLLFGDRILIGLGVQSFHAIFNVLINVHRPKGNLDEYQINGDQNLKPEFVPLFQHRS